MMQSKTDDGKLVQSFVRERSDDAFAELMRRHREFVYCVCLSELRNGALAEDAAQVAFTVLYRRAGTIGASVPVRSWLFAVARLSARGVRRRELRQMHLARQAASRTSGDADMDTSAFGSDIAAALGRLNAQDRELILQHVVDGATYAEAGQSLGLSEEAARKRVTRSLQRLRRVLGAGDTASVAASLVTLVSPSIPHHLSQSVCASAVTASALTATTAQSTIYGGVVNGMRFAQLKLVTGVTAALVVGSSSAMIVVKADGNAVASTSQRAAAIVSPEETVQKFLDARDARNKDAMTALFTVDSASLFPANSQTGSQRLVNYKALGYTDAGAAVISFLEDEQNRVGYGFKVLGADQTNPSVVKLQVAQPADGPALVLDIITVPQAGQNKIDAFATAAKADPKLSQAMRERENQVRCFRNLKQISLAMLQYVQDHDEKYPDANHWMDQISPYLPDKSVFHDPSDASGHRYSYAFNRSLSKTSLAYINSPVETVCIFESGLGTANAADTGQSIPRIGRHQSGAMYAFADGHVKYLRDSRRPKINSGR